MHSALEPERNQEDEPGGGGGGSNSLKRKFSEIDAPDSSSSPMMIDSDSNGSYELKVYDAAKNRNIIALLGTGIDKSGITNMLIKAMASSDSVKRLIIVLTPTVNLVKQQCCEIKAHVNLKVEEYFGAKGVDKWTSQRWEEEVSNHDVLVMTPQILLDALRSGFLKLDMVSLLVIDECHRTTGFHPYAKIMKEFYHKSTDKPKIFGLTTSAVVRKDKVSELENVMDSQIFNLEEQKGVEKFATTVKEGPIFYDRPPFCSLELKEKLKTSHLKFDASLSMRQEVEKGSFSNIDDKLKTYLKEMSTNYSEVLHCLDNLGLICAHLATQVCLEKISVSKEESEAYKECKEFLEDILSTIEVYVKKDLQQDNLPAVNLGRISPKLQELFRLLDSFRSETQKPCLILVERIITGEVIKRYVEKEASLAYLNVSTQALAQNTQIEISDSFHVGKVNLLFITNVIEEGYQVPNSSCMVCFDLPQTVCSYSQSQELTKQSNSKSIMFLERGSPKQRDHLYDLMRREVPMRDSETKNLKLSPPPVTNGDDVKETGVMVIPNSSITVFEEAAATQTIIDPPSTNEHLACKKLRKLDSLDNTLLQCSAIKKVASSKSKSSLSAAGSKKRKELHGTTRANALSGTWGENLDGAIFQAYKFDFSCNISEEAYSSFFLLIESTLAEDVGNVKMDLYLLKKFVKASVSPCGQIRLSDEEMNKAKCFQQFFFNGIFGKLFAGSKSLGTKREFLLETDTSSLWNPSFMFLLLPVESNSLVSSVTVDWSAINSCASVVEFVKNNHLLKLRVSDGINCNTSFGEEVLLMDEEDQTNQIHFANGSSDKNSLEEMVVIAVHTGRIYSIVDVVKDSSAMSPFEDAEYASYADYFNKKYGIVLAHLNQPLLKLKQSHHAHNLLVNFNDDMLVKTELIAGNVRKKKPNIHAHLPPELLVRIDVPRAVVKSIYLMPSVMHRLESLMLASQLREDIDCSIDNFSISSTSILEALTTLTCSEAFSMERLELLGDSVLKYVVSCSLFLKYPDKDEGQLTRQRQLIISNSNLHRLATDRKLQGYIRNGAFEPRRWTAPGQFSMFPIPCKCEIDTREVPLDPKIFTENTSTKIGKSCDMGHRWTVSKSVSDCAEALIGAYYVSGGLTGGLTAALHVMKWLGVNVEFDTKLVNEAINKVSLRSYIPKDNELTELETKIRHEFSAKFLLKEAITHSSVHGPYSYERLEFLGDSVLDFLITRHLFSSYEQTGPGEMTDLRSACVNNENFAQVAVKNNLHTHLQRCAPTLEAQINEYLMSFGKPDETGRSIPSIQGPKALGDVVESIAGALLIDTRLDLDQVWKVFEPLLSPLVTPDKLELPPYRELNELCDSLGYSFRVKCANDGVKAQATIQLQLDDVLLIGDGSEQTNKLALGKAASHLLKQLEERNISRKILIGDNQSSMDVDLACNHTDKETPESDSTETQSVVIPVIGPINMKKGGPRGTLHEFCKKHLWPMPTFDTVEEKSRTAFEFTDGDEKRTSFSSFVSTITLKIPNREAVLYTGKARPDKKSSFDSAVVELLYELERRKIVTIQK